MRTLGSLRPHLPAIVVLVVALAAAATVAAVPEKVAVDGSFAREQRARNRGYAGVRLIRDDYDRSVYAKRGSFAIVPGARPYREVPSEYPELATYFFALPYLVTRDVETYRNVWSALMALALGGLALLTSGVARRLGEQPARALLLLLPGTLYFTLNRFDVLPALLSVGAASALVGRRTALAHGLLAAAVLTRAYALLYLPLFVAASVRAGGPRRGGRDLAIFAGVLAVASAQLALWSGPDAVLEPFRFQIGRVDNPESLFHFLTLSLPAGAQPPLRWLFLGLQAAPALLAVVGARRGGRDVFRWMTAITVAFVVFARFQSPQWVVWITPLAIVAADGAGELALVIALDVLAYLYFPIGYDVGGALSATIAMAIGMIIALRIALVAAMVWPRRRQP